MNTRIDYWNEIAHGAHFTHPLNGAWILEHADPSRPVLDFGCGYGRMLKSLLRFGFTDLTGVDPSAEMIARARSEMPEAGFHVLDESNSPTFFEDGTFSLVLLVAVLTCVPDDAQQTALVSEVDRLVEPGGLLYVSDFLLQSDERNLARYDEFEAAGHPYGVFEIDAGRTTMKHHDGRKFLQLFSNFILVEHEEFDLETMKGNPAVGSRMLFRKPT